MKLADVSIRRPVFAFMMSAAIVVLGIASYRQLGLDLMPKTDFPMVVVRTSLPGASAEEIETQVTKPIEEIVNTIAGIDELRSTSQQGSSMVMITFVLERKIEDAVQDVRDKVSHYYKPVPEMTRSRRSFKRMDPDSNPILTIAVSGDRSQKEISQIVDKQIKQVLETVQNVGEVSFTGDRHREIQLLLNEDRMNAYGLTVDQVRNAVQRQNVEIPGGSFLSGPAEIALRTMGRIQNVEDFNKIIIAYSGGSVITFGDIGRVLDTVEEPRSVARLDGRDAVSLNIRKQSGTNTVEVVDAVMARLERIKQTLPPDIKVQTTRDQSLFIRRSFEEIQHHLILGGLLASIVVLLFMRNFRSTIIAARRDPGIDHRHFHVNESVWLHHEQHDDACAFSCNRDRYRRCDCGTGKHLPLRGRKESPAPRSRIQGNQRNRTGCDGDDTVAGRDIPACRLHDRTDRPILLQLRHRLGFCVPDFDVHFLHLDAGSLRAHG